jgi:SAM-dependent methyltransferase
MNKTKIDSEMINILLNVINSNIYVYGNEIGKTRHIEKSQGSYHFINNNTYSVIKRFIRLKNYLFEERRWSGHDTYPSRFLDVGCGIGNILLFAKHAYLCNEYLGLEYFDKTIKLGRKWLKEHGANKRTHVNKIKMLKRDIMTYKSYGLADIIYYYCPFENHKMQKVLELRIEEQMKKGAILVPYLKQCWDLDKDDRFEVIRLDTNAPIYIKVS